MKAKRPIKQKRTSIQGWSGGQAVPKFVRMEPERQQHKTVVGTADDPKLWLNLRKKRRLFRIRYLLLLLLIGFGLSKTQIFSSLFFQSPRAGKDAISLLWNPIGAKGLLISAPEAKRKASVVHLVKDGESFGKIVHKYGLGPGLGTLLYQELLNFGKKNSMSGQLRAGQEIIFYLSPKTGLEEVEVKLQANRTLRMLRQSNGSFKTSLKAVPKTTRERIALGQVKTSFAAAAEKARVSYDIVDDFVDLFSDRVVFHEDFRKNDRFTIIYQEEITNQQEVTQAGPILAAALNVQGKNMVAIRYVGTDGKARYFNEQGELLGNTFLRYPVKFSRISSYFSKSRFHPVLKKRRPHNGVDFAAPTGTPVRSVAHGKVTFAAYKGANGNMVKIKHGDRYSTAYVHLSKIAPGIRRGVSVQRGQIIGAVGATGRATGPHLHFAFYDRGKYVDPLKIKLPTMELNRKNNINPAYLERVLFTVQRYQKADLGKLQWDS